MSGQDLEFETGRSREGRRCSAPNPTGRNQHRNCRMSPSLIELYEPPENVVRAATKDDSRVEEALRDYQRRNIVNKETIKQLLLAEHGIEMSTATITRRRKLLGLKGSGATTKSLPETQKRQLILDQMAKHPTPKWRSTPPVVLAHGVSRRVSLATRSSVYPDILSRDYISAEMHALDPDGFVIRQPKSKKKHRVALVVLGPDFEWSCDGHDKLSGIGFPIWGVRDVWCGKWLGLWVVPNNRLKRVIAYLYLRLVKERGGMPVQTTTDRGSETTGVYAFASALREEFSRDLPVDQLPAHRFLPSIENTTIERGWLRLRLEWGDDVKLFWEAGKDIYNEMDPRQYELVQYLWPKLIQQELDSLRERLNNHKPRRDNAKLTPTGVAPAVAYTLAERYGGERGLQPVDTKLIEGLMEELGGEDLVRFVSRDYEARADEIFSTIGVEKLSFANVWMVFERMLPLM
ncbi:hypothetical protein OH76DRAFT_1423158 [Lentinus brumalis]|uniref:Integrase catalytic domain-containing protein n=1 Tax=Lentinus brumalis TaxID=2498619 RepID=A0A371CM70_9APHY|nr:hypothetical protein OH76DRAFT_1423158 [Polyporus brumalis]